MKPRCGSHADADADAGAMAVVGVGGRGGGICRCRGEALLVRADRLAIDPGDALDLSLAGPGFEQGPDGRLQVRLQDVHSVPPLKRGRK
jgi:hypothetical protein